MVWYHTYADRSWIDDRCHNVYCCAEDDGDDYGRGKVVVRGSCKEQIERIMFQHDGNLAVRLSIGS